MSEERTKVAVHPVVLPWVVLRDRHGFPYALQVRGVVDDMGKIGAWVHLPPPHPASMQIVRRLYDERRAKRYVTRWRKAAVRILEQNSQAESSDQD